VTVTDDMWATASADLDTDRSERLLAVAQVRCSGLWPFLAGAGSDAEYAQRRALVTERVEATCDGVSPRDPVLVGQVLAGLDADFRALHAARTPERELARQVETELARRTAVAAPKRIAHVAALHARMVRAASLRRQADEQHSDPPPDDPDRDPEGADPTAALLQQPEPLSVGAPRTAAWPYGSGASTTTCPKCQGTGELPAQYLDEGHRGGGKSTCDLCDGDGEVPESEAHAWHTSARTAGVRHTAPGGGEHAPYRLRRKGDGEWEVVNDRDEVKGTHPSKEEARDQQQALYANVPGARESAERDDHRKAASRTATVMRDVTCASCGRQARVDISRGTGANPTPCPHCGSTALHLADTTHNRYSALRAACAKCEAGRTPDGEPCSYCDGVGRLDPATALVKAADGWDQGLVRLTAEGAVSFDPQAFGSARWQKLPPTLAPAWIVDQYGPTNTPLVGGTPNPLATMHGPSGGPLRDTRSYRPPVRAGLRSTANPYLDDNPYRTDGPGQPGNGAPNISAPQQPGQPPQPGQAPAPEEVPLASGAAQPVVQDEQLPHPEDERGARTSTRQPAPEFSGGAPDVADRLAARVLAANPECSPVDARRVALATLRRFPAVASERTR
jgi:hypothetical protein